MSDDCPFCQMIEGRLDSYTVYETANALAFLDINPSTKGHTLVVPKEHAEDLMAISTDTVGPFFEAVQHVADAIDTALDPAGINLIQANGKAAGQEIAHAHMHIVPRYDDDDVSIEYNPSELEESTGKDLEQRLREAT